MSATRILLFASCIAVGGCHLHPTRALINVVVADGVAAPEQLTLTVYGPNGVLATQTGEGRRLPGVFVVVFPDRATHARVGIIGTPDSGSASASLSFDLVPHRDVGVNAILGAIEDTDADGVPDDIDNCQTIANPDQTSANGTDGDACSAQNDPCGPAGGPLDGGAAVSCVIGKGFVADGGLTDWPSGALPHVYSIAYDSPGVIIGPTTTDWPSGTGARSSTLSGQFALGWDLEYLYVSVQVTDDHRGVHATPDGGYHFMDDAIEVYVDGDGAHSDTYQEDDNHLVSLAIPGSTLFAHLRNRTPLSSLPAWRSSLLVKIADGESGANWKLQMAIPWSAMGTSPPSNGRRIGFDVLLADNDDPPDPSVPVRYLVWQANNNAIGCVGCGGGNPCFPSCSPSAMGWAQLIGR